VFSNASGAIHANVNLAVEKQAPGRRKGSQEIVLSQTFAFNADSGEEMTRTGTWFESAMKPRVTFKLDSAEICHRCENLLRFPTAQRDRRPA